jgi:alginate O-acetyltransferase complex protein AlgI
VLFNSAEFVFLFLPVVVAGARLARGWPLMAWLAAASWFFYAFAGSAFFLLPMLVTTALDFWLGMKIDEAKGVSRRALLLTSLCCNLGLLAYFKYGRFLLESAQTLGLPVGGGLSLALDVALPAGISFYTFQTMSYVIDVYRGQCAAERRPLTFATFVAFFPHLVAGPLTRHDQLIPQLDRIGRGGISPRWREGVFLFAIGLMKKVFIADRLAQLGDPLIADIAHAGVLTAWLTMLGFALQIYFDFSGYTDMAIGLGRLFGVELPQNFDSPYLADSPADFWRRWHITLSRWLRDYLYIPLGGNRASPLRRDINLMITMLLGGLWHGASWTFVAWGAWHGALLVGHRHAEGRFGPLPPMVRRAVTFLAVCLGWVLFRSKTFGQATAWLAALIGAHGAGVEAWSASMTIYLALVSVGLCGCWFLKPASARTDLAQLSAPWRVALGAGAAAAVMCFSLGTRFLYFEF